MPPGAEFAVIMTDSSMEPCIKRGETVYCGRARSLDVGDVGLFLLRGRMVCRQYVEDSEGYIYLLTPGGRGEDFTVPPGEDVTLIAKVLLSETPPI